MRAAAPISEALGAASDHPDASSASALGSALHGAAALPASHPDPLPAPRADIQALRALAVSAVVLYHFWPGLVPAGFVGVDIFFVISGFLVGGPLLRKALRGEPFALTQFYSRRLRRILPSAYVTIVVTLVGVLVLAPSTRLVGAAREAIASVLYVQNINLSRISVDYLAQDSPDSFFRHFWSLSVEEQFYLFFPLLLLVCAFALGRSPKARVWVIGGSFGVLILGSLIYSAWLVATGNPTGYFLLSSRFWELGVGVAVAVLPSMSSLRDQGWSGARAWGKQSVSVSRCAVWTLWLVLVVSVYTTNAQAFPGLGAVLPVAATALLLWLGGLGGQGGPGGLGRLGSRGVEQARWGHGRREGDGADATSESAWRHARSRCSALVLHVGAISYSLYLTHWPVLLFLPIVLGRPAGATDYLVGLAVAVLLAELLYRLVDQRFQRVRVTRANVRPILMLSAVASLGVVLVGMGVLGAATGANARTAEQQEKEIAKNFAALGHHAFAQDGPGGHTDPTEFALAVRQLYPSPETVRSFLPDGADGRCKSGMADPFTPRCFFAGPSAGTDRIVTQPPAVEPTSDGVRGSSKIKKIALVGDSHAEQYLPAFQLIARDQGLAVDTYFHSSCPFSTAQRTSDAARGGPCRTANEATLAALLGGDYDVVITSNRTAMAFVDAPGIPSPVDGFREVWTELSRAGIPVVVIADNPVMLPSEGTTECLVAAPGTPQECALPAAEALRTDHQIEAARKTPSVSLIDTRGWFCSETRCPAVIGNVVVYRDEQHISVLFAETLAQDLWRQVEPVVEDRGE